MAARDALRRLRRRLASLIAPAPQKRAYYGGAASSRLTGDWFAALVSADAELKSDLRKLRQRSRQLVRDSGYAAGAVEEIVENLIGQAGIQLQAKLSDPAGQPAREVNRALERAWAEWSYPENASVDERDGWVDLQKLVVRAVVVDGEAFVRVWDGADNPFGLALELIDADCVDGDYNLEPGPGRNRVVMGIELDARNRRVAYHVFDRHPSDTGPKTRLRIPAREVLHVFPRLRANAQRGLPWLTPVLLAFHMLEGYAEAEITAARIGASQMGALVSKGEEAVGKWDPEDQPQIELAPGSFPYLPPGVELQSFSPEHPNVNYDAFINAALRGVARGIGMSYLSLTGDASAANFSSMRAAFIPERERWRSLQRWLSCHLHRVVFKRWLPNALLSGKLALDPRFAADYDGEAIRWNPRGWQYVQPVDELEAAERSLRLGLVSRQELAAEKGRDFEDVIDDIAAEQDYAQQQGVDVSGSKGATPSSSSPLLASTEEAVTDPAEGSANNPPKEQANGHSAANGKPRRFAWLAAR